MSQKNLGAWKFSELVNGGSASIPRIFLYCVADLAEVGTLRSQRQRLQYII